MAIDYDKVRRLVALVEQNKLIELAVEEEGISVTIKAETPGAAVSAPVSGSIPAHAYADVHPYDMHEYEESAATEEPESAAAHIFEIKSPMIGVFYRTPSPDSPPFVEVGEQIEAGQTVGLIEAMKVFSEIPSEVAGRVLSIPVEHATLVQQGDVLLVLDTSGID